MPKYHAADVEVRLSVTDLAQSVTCTTSDKIGTAAKNNVERAEAALSVGDVLSEVAVPCLGDDGHVHFLGRYKNMPFLMVKAGKPKVNHPFPTPSSTRASSVGNALFSRTAQLALAQSVDSLLSSAQSIDSSLSSVRSTPEQLQDAPVVHDERIEQRGNPGISLDMARHTNPAAPSSHESQSLPKPSIRPAAVIKNTSTTLPLLKALTLSINVSPQKSFRRSQKSRKPQDLKFDVFFNGQLDSSTYLNLRYKPDIPILTKRISGRKIDRIFESAWILNNQGANIRAEQEYHFSDGARLDSQKRWNDIGKAITAEADAYGINSRGERPPVGEYLTCLAELDMPDTVLAMQMSGEKKFGVIDVVISLGQGKKYETNKGFLYEPRRLADDRFKVKALAPPRNNCSGGFSKSAAVARKDGNVAHEGITRRLRTPLQAGPHNNAAKETNEALTPLHKSSVIAPSIPAPSRRQRKATAANHEHSTPSDTIEAVIDENGQGHGLGNATRRPDLRPRSRRPDENKPKLGFLDGARTAHIAASNNGYRDSPTRNMMTAMLPPLEKQLTTPVTRRDSADSDRLSNPNLDGHYQYFSRSSPSTVHQSDPISFPVVWQGQNPPTLQPENMMYVNNLVDWTPYNGEDPVMLGESSNAIQFSPSNTLQSSPSNVPHFSPSNPPHFSPSNPPQSEAITGAKRRKLHSWPINGQATASASLSGPTLTSPWMTPPYRPIPRTPLSFTTPYSNFHMPSEPSPFVPSPVFNNPMHFPLLSYSQYSPIQQMPTQYMAGQYPSMQISPAHQIPMQYMDLPHPTMQTSRMQYFPMHDSVRQHMPMQDLRLQNPIMQCQPSQYSPVQNIPIHRYPPEQFLAGEASSTGRLVNRIIITLGGTWLVRDSILSSTFILRNRYDRNTEQPQNPMLRSDLQQMNSMQRVLHTSPKPLKPLDRLQRFFPRRQVSQDFSALQRLARRPCLGCAVGDIETFGPPRLSILEGEWSVHGFSKVASKKAKKQDRRVVPDVEDAVQIKESLELKMLSATKPMDETARTRIRGGQGEDWMDLDNARKMIDWSPEKMGETDEDFKPANAKSQTAKSSTQSKNRRRAREQHDESKNDAQHVLQVVSPTPAPALPKTNHAKKEFVVPLLSRGCVITYAQEMRETLGSKMGLGTFYGTRQVRAERTGQFEETEVLIGVRFLVGMDAVES